jgi:hypothetical protein
MCGTWSEAREHARGWVVDSGRGRRVRALQVFDNRLARRAQANAVTRKCTKTTGHACLVRGRDRSLVARWLGQGNSFHRWDMPRSA